MNERRVFVVETVQTVRFLVDKGVVLGHELPTNFRWHNTGVVGGTGCRSR